jgi:hypothetical protein
MVLLPNRGLELPPNYFSRKIDRIISTRLLSLEILVASIVYILFIALLWYQFLPMMEDSYEETNALLEGGSNTGNLKTIHGDFIPEIRLAHILSIRCYGIVDGIIVFTLWQSNIKKDQVAGEVLIARSYYILRAFSVFIVTMLTIVILVGTDPGFYLTLLFISIPIFSILSLLYLYYFKTHFIPGEGEHKVLFKIPEES